MPADHVGVGGIPDQPIACPHPETLERALALGKIIEPIAKVPIVWAHDAIRQRWDQNMISSFQEHLLERWNAPSEYFTREEKEHICTQYAIYRLEKL